MNYKQFLKCLLTIAILFCALTNIRAQEMESTEANTPDENVVLQWNRVLQQTISTPGQHPATIFQTRPYAMMHAAIFDAVNSIDGTYTPYLIEVPRSGRASRDDTTIFYIGPSSREAAAAQAAHDVLVALYPTRATVFDTELANSLNGISPRQAGEGIRVGQIVAARILAVRANDGWNVTPPSYVLPPTPGNWQLAPGNTIATFTHYPGVLPFAIGSATRFMSNPPPAMTSDEYARDFNEVKALGSATSTTRTADQTQIAQVWAGVNTPTNLFAIWNTVARNIAIQRNTTTAENARLFALLNISSHDTLQTTFAGKYQYGLWRPVTAIRRADEDGNPNTAPDVNWTSLIANPAYPTYPGNQTGMGMSQATILALFFGRDDIPYQSTWEGAGGATRSYAGFHQMANEQGRSRVYGGIHFEFDQVAGQSAGRNVANYVFLNFMKPRSNN